MFETIAFAAGETSAASGGMGGILSLILPFALIFVVMYFLMIRPQKKKDKMMQDMLNDLRIGDVILTIGGILGKIVKIKDDVLTIETGNPGTPNERTIMKVKRWSVKEIEKPVEDDADLEPVADTKEDSAEDASSK